MGQTLKGVIILNHVIVWLLLLQPFVDHLAHIEYQQKLKVHKSNLSLICQTSTPRDGYQKAIYNRMNCLSKMSNRSVKA